MVAREEEASSASGAMSGELGLAGAAAYGATKAALSSMTRAWTPNSAPAGAGERRCSGPVHTGGALPVRDLIQHLGSTTP